MSALRPRIVGLFVVIAIGIGVSGVLLLGSGRWFRETQKFVIFFDGSLSGLNPGAPVKFRGVEIGDVDEVLFNIFGSATEADLRLPVIIELDEHRLVARGATIDLSDAVFIDSMIRIEGLRAQLAVESFVTGRRYIELGEHPETDYALRNDPGIPYPELPSIPPFGLEDITEDAQQLLVRLATVDVGNLVDRLTTLAQDVRSLARDPSLAAALDSLPAVLGNLNATLTRYADLAERVDTTVLPVRATLGRTLDEADVTLREMRTTMEDMRAVVTPGSPVVVQLESTLRELSTAARSLRDLAEYLQRNPSAIVRGKPEDSE